MLALREAIFRIIDTAARPPSNGVMQNVSTKFPTLLIGQLKVYAIF